MKPQNLLVDEHWNVKVCDFGLSQVKLREEKIRDGKSIPGTPLWMAPEVLLGKDVDEKADVYSYGIGMYFLFYLLFNYLHYYILLYITIYLIIT